MKNNIEFDYLVIGAGPAGLCAIAKLLSLGIESAKIAWCDPEFKVGDFGSLLSEGSSIPSNTKVLDFREVNEELYACLPPSVRAQHSIKNMILNQLSPSGYCTLKIAAEPMQALTDLFLTQVKVFKSQVLELEELPNKVRAQIKLSLSQEEQRIYAQRVILATGAQPKSLDLPGFTGTYIDPYTAMIESKLQAYLSHNPLKGPVALIGSSHTAALCLRQLMKVGVTVKQFMNKPYRFARACNTEEGVPYVQFDNTGLKGEVAEFIRTLNTKRTNPNWEIRISKHSNQLLQDYFAYCRHIVVAIGFAPRATLTVNGLPLSQVQYDPFTLAIKGSKRVFGLGIAFPQRHISYSSEIEYAVGYRKFWATVNDSAIVHAWTDPIN